MQGFGAIVDWSMAHQVYFYLILIFVVVGLATGGLINPARWFNKRAAVKKKEESGKGQS